MKSEILKEVNYIISGGNKYYNFEKFENDENGKLFIVGLSGSGKSTIGMDLARKYKSSYVKLDDIDRGYRKSIIKRLKKDWDKDRWLSFYIM